MALVGKSHTIEVSNYDTVKGRFTDNYYLKNGTGSWRRTTRLEIDEYLDRHYHVIWNPGAVKRVTFIDKD